MKMWLYIAAFAALLCFAAGCSGSGEVGAAVEVTAPNEGNASGSHSSPAASPTDAPAQPQHGSDNQEPPKAETPKQADGADSEKNVISVASPQSESIDPEEETTAGKSDAASRPSQDWRFDPSIYGENYSFDPQHPTLMGLTIGTDSDHVVKMFGEPLDKTLLPDDSVQAAVFAYPGFSVGVSGKKVLFVEVSSKEIDPGLNGVLIGDSRDAAISMLGTPSLSSTYVISYSNDNTVLKIDLDPDTLRIVSMKLFPQS